MSGALPLTAWEGIGGGPAPRANDGDSGTPEGVAFCAVLINKKAVLQTAQRQRKVVGGGEGGGGEREIELALITQAGISM